MIRHLLLALALSAGVSSAAQAQQVFTVASCSATGVSNAVGTTGRFYAGPDGVLCVSGGSGGGGTGGSVTQGTSPWVISGNSTANASGNPLFANITNLPSVQAISAASLPLPAGAATSANQTSEIAALGATGDAAYAGSGTASLIAALKGVYSLLDQVPAAVDASYGPATTPTNALAANAKRAAVYVFNPNAFPVYINFARGASTTAVTAGNITIPAGGDWRSPQGMAPKTAMSIVAGTAGGVVTIMEGSVP